MCAMVGNIALHHLSHLWAFDKEPFRNCILSGKIKSGRQINSSNY